LVFSVFIDLPRAEASWDEMDVILLFALDVAVH